MPPVIKALNFRHTCKAFDPDKKIPFLVAGRTELPAFAGECQEVFMAAFVTPDPGKPHVEIPAVQVFIT